MPRTAQAVLGNNMSQQPFQLESPEDEENQAVCFLFS